MGGFTFISQKTEKVAPKIEQLIRKEIGAGAPLAYTIEDGTAQTASVGSAFRDAATALVGGAAKELFQLDFQLPQPRPASLQVSVCRQGVGSYVGLLLYSSRLAQPVASEVVLEEAGGWGKSKFVGDAAACAKLNAHKDLLKRVNRLARTEWEMSAITVKIKRICRIEPQDGGSLFVVGTLPRPVWFGFSASADAKEFFDVAAMIEAALR